MTGVNNDKMKKVFLKREFYTLNIIGQFNLGFVCCSLNNGRDLFILDQHACHERYNLERFNKELKIASQLIMFPITMTIDHTLAPLLSKYSFIFEFNGLKFKLPDDFDEVINSG
jgi:DNA mismatch repair protein PMS2